MRAGAPRQTSNRTSFPLFCRFSDQTARQIGARFEELTSPTSLSRRGPLRERDVGLVSSSKRAPICRAVWSENRQKSGKLVRFEVCRGAPALIAETARAWRRRPRRGGLCTCRRVAREKGRRSTGLIAYF